MLLAVEAVAPHSGAARANAAERAAALFAARGAAGQLVDAAAAQAALLERVGERPSALFSDEVEGLVGRAEESERRVWERLVR